MHDTHHTTALAHAILSHHAATFAGFAPEPVPSPTSQDPVYLAALQACSQLGFIAHDAECLARSEKAVAELGYSSKPMVSGAGHDACYVSKIAPASMIFIPCVKGISHNEAERILPEWSEKGANVLLHSVLAAAQEQ